jgi:uncharacterized integral membrane protein
MRKFFNAAVLIPLGLIFLVFAVANRHIVTVSFDPFNSHDAALSFELPLFVVIIAVAILGVVAGGAATWFGQRRWRAHATMSQRQDSTPPATVPQVGYRRDKHGATL